MGQSGPHSGYTGFGIQLAALAGFTWVTGWPDRSPDMPFLSYTDFVAHRFLIIALLEALFRRERTGKGCYIDHSQHESSLQLLITPLLDYQVNGIDARVAAIAILMPRRTGHFAALAMTDGA